MSEKHDFYDVITAQVPEELAHKVNVFIMNGWEPLGGVSVSLSESDDYQYILFAQAMIKRSNKDEAQPQPLNVLKGIAQAQNNGGRD